jgi:hypothetical protein
MAVRSECSPTWGSLEDVPSRGPLQWYLPGGALHVFPYRESPPGCSKHGVPSTVSPPVGPLNWDRYRESRLRVLSM